MAKPVLPIDVYDTLTTAYQFVDTISVAQSIAEVQSRYDRELEPRTAPQMPPVTAGLTARPDVTTVDCSACERKAGEECNLIFERDPKGIARNKFAYFKLIHIARWAAAGKLAEVEWAIEGQS